MVSFLDRSEITFAQAEGAVPLPRQLELREVSSELRSAAWALIFGTIQSDVNVDVYGTAYLSETWRKLVLRWEVEENKRFADEIDYTPMAVISRFKDVIAHRDYVRFYSTIEFFIRSPERLGGLAVELGALLRRTRSAYRVVGRSIMPFASEGEAEAVKAAFQLLNQGKFAGARMHLSKAGSDLTRGDWTGSVHESVNAVESAARVLAPGTKALGAALVELEKVGTVHEALKRGFGSLYGFSSNEQGIRHPLINASAANVDEADAMYMFGSCAAFVTYLALKTKA